MRNTKKLIRSQLDANLQKFKPLKNIAPPVKGWICAIKDALGMNGRQLADRMGVHRSRTKQLEQQELAGSLTIKMLRKTAEALDCVFVYGFVPKTTLEETVRYRAKQVAEKRFSAANQTMALENQSLNAEESREVIAEEIDKLVETSPSNLWDEL
jgi:predicted DNA-binding mobile mystery protein A